MNLYLLDIKISSHNSIQLICINKKLRGEIRRITIKNIYQPYYIRHSTMQIACLKNMIISALADKKYSFEVKEKYTYESSKEEYIKILPFENITYIIDSIKNRGDFIIYQEFTDIAEQVIIEQNLRTPSHIYIGSPEDYRSIKILDFDGIPDFKFAAIAERENKFYISITSYHTFKETQIAEGNYICKDVREVYYLLNTDDVFLTVSYNCTMRRGVDFDLKEYLINTFANKESIKSYSLEEMVELYGLNWMTHYSENILFLLHQLNIFNSFREMAMICNIPISIIFKQSSIVRTEYLLNRELYGNNIILSERVRPTHVNYEGGLVLDPKIGHYRENYIALVDFNSLYPSIIIENSLCFTAHHLLPKILKKLIERRQLATNEIERQAYKILANSIYGCFGTRHFKYYDPKLASQITERGRHLLLSTRDVFLSKNYEVIYGDTDSLMINMKIPVKEDIQLVKTEIENILKEINRPGAITLALEKIFSNLILYGKKCYGGYYVENGHTVLHYRGLDISRKDLPFYLNTILKTVFVNLLNGDLNAIERQKRSIYEDIRSVPVKNLNAIERQKRSIYEDIRSVPVKNLIIYKTLKKNLNEYEGGVHHVDFARRVGSTLNIQYRKNSIVEYLYGIIGQGSSITSRMVHMRELAQYEIDYPFYVKHLFLPHCKRLLIFHEKAERTITLREKIREYYFTEQKCRNGNCDNTLLINYCTDCDEYFENIYERVNEEFDIFLDLYRVSGDEELYEECVERSGYRMIDMSLYFK